MRRSRGMLEKCFDFCDLTPARPRWPATADESPTLPESARLKSVRLKTATLIRTLLVSCTSILSGRVGFDTKRIRGGSWYQIPVRQGRRVLFARRRRRG